MQNQLIVAALKQRKSVQSIWQLSVTIQQALIFSDGERNLTQQSGGRKLLSQEVVSVYVQKCREMRNILCDISNLHLTSLGLVEEECFSNVCCSVGHIHDICQNIYTSRLWTNYVLPERHTSRHLRQNSVKSWRLWMGCRTYMWTAVNVSLLYWSQ